MKESKGDLPLSSKEINKTSETKETTWPEMASLVEADEGNMVISDPSLIKMAKILSTAGKERINYESLSGYLQEGDKKYFFKDTPEEEWSLVSGVLVNKMGELEKDKSVLERTLKDLSNSSKKTAESTEKIAESTEETKKRIAGEQTDVLPNDEKEQREIIINLIEQLESTDLPLAPVPNFLSLGNNPTIVSRINALLASEVIKEGVKEEAMARMRLQHCSAVVEAIPGSEKEAKEYLFSTFSSAESKRYLLEGEDLEFLFKKLESVSGLKIADAFEGLQSAWMEGIKINGKIISLSDKDLSFEEIRKAEDTIKEKLGEEKKAIKALQLAKRIAKATLETSVWNRNIVGNDPLAECIYFRNYRQSRGDRGSDTGPKITISRIDGFATSFLRSTMIKDRGKKNPLFMSKEVETTASLEERVRDFFKRKRGEKVKLSKTGITLETTTDKDGLLNPKKMEFGEIFPGSYESWLIRLVGVFACKSLLLQSSWEPKDINSDAVEKWVSPFEAADPEQKMRLRVDFVLGMFGSVFSNMQEAMNQGWDNFSLQAVFGNLTHYYITEKGEKVGFLAKEQLNWITKNMSKHKFNIENKAVAVGLGIRTTKRVIQR